MSPTTSEKRAAFRALHQEGCFVIPNPWDLGSARLLQTLGFAALASTSSGYAWSRGRPDYGITLEDALHHLSELSAAVDIPVNADFEGGFAVEPEGVAANVRRAVDTGIAGVSIEDRTEYRSLFDRSLAIARIRAARQAIDASGQDVLLVARCEGLLFDPSTVAEAIDRLVAFAEAGADVLYAPGVTEKGDIAAMVRAVAPKPVNVLALRAKMPVAELAELGVRRISVGGGLARVALAAALAAAERFQRGDLTGLEEAAPSQRLNEVMASFPQR